MATYYRDKGNVSDAIRWYKSIIERHPATEDAHFQLMKLYKSKENFSLMMQQYNDLHNILHSEFGEGPSDNIVDWYVGTLK